MKIVTEKSNISNQSESLNNSSESIKATRYAILGMGVSGRAACHFLLFKGASVCGIDHNPHQLMVHPEIEPLIKLGLTLREEKDIHELNQFDVIVVSPGIPLDHRLVKMAKQAKIRCIGEIELGCQATHNPIIGITGTNGKTTVTLLITHVLNQCNQSAIALGNVGAPLTKELITLKEQTIVLELSSYQLETLYQSCLESSAILNITPDHLDRYKTMVHYAQAKCQISNNIKPGHWLYVEENVWKQYSHLLDPKVVRQYGYSPSSYISTDLLMVYQNGQIAFILPPSLQGKKSHDLENMLAAYAICADRGIKGPAFLKAWQTFQKPPHRIDLFITFKGIRFFDDSKGTNVDAVIRAVQSIEGPIILIAGGVDKNFPYHSWIEGFKDKVHHIFAIGEAAKKMHAQLSSNLPITICNTLDNAVKQSIRLAQKGDNVLLSPGCSSFDMFRDYVHRGQEFQRIVRELLQEEIII